MANAVSDNPAAWQRGLLAVLLVVGIVATGWLWRSSPWPTAVEQKEIRYRALSLLAGAEWDRVEVEDRLVQAGPRGGTLTFASLPLGRVRQIELEITPRAPLTAKSCTLFFATGRLWDNYLEDPSQIILRRGVRPTVTEIGSRWRLVWNLPRAALWLRLDLPADAEFEVEHVVLRGTVASDDDAPLSFLPETLRLLGWGLLTGGLWLGLVLLWPVLRPTGGSVRGLILGLVAASGLVLALTLPPFQAPDENRHWQAALDLYRAEARSERPLYFLPEIVEALPPRWLAHVPFEVGPLGNLPRESLRAEGVSVGYGSRLTYPVVALVAWCWPRVESVTEALVFYYICRLLSLALAVGLLWLGLRLGLVGFTLLLFWATPSMLQQSVAVTSDTVVNLGSLATAMMFVTTWRQPTLARQVGLWTLALVVTVAKPPTALLLLPLALLPWRRLPWKPVLVPLLVVLAGLAAWGALELGVRLVIRSDPFREAEVLKQYDLLKQGPGLSNFGTALRGLLPPTWTSWDEWYHHHQPLGWLDTDLHPWHRFLIYLGLGFGLVFDGLAGARTLRTALRTRPLAVLGLVLLGLAHAVALVVGISLLLFLANTPAGGTGFVGVQHRYFFPAVLILLMLPAALRQADEVSNDGPSATDSSGWAAALWATAAGAVLLSLLAARVVLLALDVGRRYGP
ncbi:MAG TPA: DUF2142 domain-containing protein [Gemmatales bacterium]|mgnify:FL=1|nr:DUF2142 domain-containing protein [Gemmatales bacterium]